MSDSRDVCCGRFEINVVHHPARLGQVRAAGGTNTRRAARHDDDVAFKGRRAEAVRVEARLRGGGGLARRRALRGRVAGRSARGESCARQQAFGCGCLLSMSQGCVKLPGTSEATEAAYSCSHHCGGGAARMCRPRLAHDAKQMLSGSQTESTLASVLKPLARSCTLRQDGKGRSSRSMGTCGGAPSSFPPVRGAPRRRPRPRLSSAAASRDLSQRPSRALVRHFGIVPEVRASRIFGFCSGFAVPKTCPATCGGPEVSHGQASKRLRRALVARRPRRAGLAKIRALLSR